MEQTTILPTELPRFFHSTLKTLMSLHLRSYIWRALTHISQRALTHMSW